MVHASNAAGAGSIPGWGTKIPTYVLVWSKSKIIIIKKKKTTIEKNMSLYFTKAVQNLKSMFSIPSIFPLVSLETLRVIFCLFNVLSKETWTPLAFEQQLQ